MGKRRRTRRCFDQRLTGDSETARHLRRRKQVTRIPGWEGEEEEREGMEKTVIEEGEIDTVLKDSKCPFNVQISESKRIEMFLMPQIGVGKLLQIVFLIQSRKKLIRISECPSERTLYLL